MNRIRSRLLTPAILASCLFASVVHADGKGLQLRDVFELEFAADPQISPDGKQVVYARNFMDIMKDKQRSNLWIINSDGSEHRPLTSGNENHSQPRWSPDGTRIAYVSNEEGSSEIYCRWVDTGQIAKLTRLEAEPANLAWSPDGESLAFTMFVLNAPEPFVELPKKPEGAEWAEPAKLIRRTMYRFDGKGYLKEGFHHIFVLPAEGGTPRQLTNGSFHHDGRLAWSHDSKSLLFSANRSENWEYEPRESELYEVDLASLEIVQRTKRVGPDFAPVVSPDGKQIAWIGFDDHKMSYQNSLVYVMNWDGSKRRTLTEKMDREVESPLWAGDGQGIFFQYDDLGTTRVGHVTLDGKVTKIADHVGGVTLGRPYASGSFSVSNDGAVAFTRSLPTFPAEVAVQNKAGDSHQLTHLNDDLFADKEIVDAEEFTFKSSFDGKQIQAWLVKPIGFDPTKKYPLILEIHGGPFANYGDRFSTEIQLYAAAGYAVVYVNPRGSTGYGEEFANLIHHKYPGNDFDDLMSAVDNVIARGFVDEKNLNVTGGSGGGILTAWVVGKTNRFRAAVSAKPVINWYSFVLTTDAYPYFTQYWFPGAPWKNVEQYLRRSPISLVNNVTTPTMLLTGENDHRTPISESEQFYQALKLRKVPTAMVRIPDASHAIVKRPSRYMVKVAHILKWFEIHKAEN